MSVEDHLREKISTLCMLGGMFLVFVYVCQVTYEYM